MNSPLALRVKTALTLFHGGQVTEKFEKCMPEPATQAPVWPINLNLIWFLAGGEFMDEIPKWVKTGLPAALGLLVLVVVVSQTSDQATPPTTFPSPEVSLPVVSDSTTNAAVQMAPEATPEIVRKNALAECADRYPADFTMRAACKRNAERGADDYRRLREKYHEVPEMQQALSECVERYTEGGSVDFSMIGACARNNDRGFKELSR